MHADRRYLRKLIKRSKSIFNGRGIMRQRIAFLLLSALLLSLFSAIRSNVVASSNTITVPTDFLTIQDAVNNATDGDVVFVLNGTYYENVVLNKTVSLIGENKSTTIIDGGGADTVVYVTANNVSIAGFTIQNSGSNMPDSGIFIRNARYLNITGNILTSNHLGVRFVDTTDNHVDGNKIVNNYVGLYLTSASGHMIEENDILSNSMSGVHLDQSSGNTVRSNNIGGNGGYGIRLYYSMNNILDGNTVTDSEQGISLEYSGNNTLRNERISLSKYSFSVMAVSLSSFIQNIDTSNTVNNRPIYYLVNQEDLMVDSFSEAGYVALINSTDIIVKDLSLTNNGEGILCAYTTLSTLENNTISNNRQGISIHDSEYLTVTQNSITNNSGNGVSLYNCYKNNVKDNVIARNDVGIFSYSVVNCTISSNNVTNNSKEGFVILGSSYNMISQNFLGHNDEEGLYMFNSYGNVVNDNVADGNMHDGIWVDTCINNIISGNNVSRNGEDGIYLLNSFGCAVQYNRVVGNSDGINVYETNNGAIVDNLVSDNLVDGVRLYDSSNNRIFHNNFLNNTYQVEVFGGSKNSWDDGYPSGGNYWDDYMGTDLYWGPYQNITGSDGIGDTPIIINEHNRDRYPLMTRFRFHDVAVLNVALGSDEVFVGWIVDINITVKNTGGHRESINVTAFYDDAIVGTLIVYNVSVGESITVPFAWNTTGLTPCHSYVVKGEAGAVPGEANLDDNVYVAGLVKIKFMGDINGDERVDIRDITIVAMAFGSKLGDERWNQIADLNIDDVIDIRDITLTAINFGKKCPP